MIIVSSEFQKFFDRYLTYVLACKHSDWNMHAQTVYHFNQLKKDSDSKKQPKPCRMNIFWAYFGMMNDGDSILFLPYFQLMNPFKVTLMMAL